MAKTKKRRAKRAAAKSAPVASPPNADPPSRPLVTNAAIFAAVGVLVGAGLGWFLRDMRANTPEAPTADGAPAGSSGACGTWQQQICDGIGAESGDCAQAKAAAQMLPDKACAAALTEVIPTLDKIKQGRSVCDELATKLCADVGSTSPQTCEMIKKRMAAMPTAACEERRQNYPMLLNQLKQLSTPRRPPGLPPGAGAPPGGDPHGHGHDHGDHAGHDH